MLLYLTKVYFRKYLNRKKKSIFVTFFTFFCCLLKNFCIFVEILIIKNLNIMQKFKQLLKKANQLLKECAKGASYAINN